MSTHERIVGNIFAAILIGIMIVSICTTVFSFLFRDGRGISPYGGRGNVYYYESE